MTPGIGVQKVLPDFPAARAGMMDNDVIITFDGESIPEDRETFIEMVSKHAPGSVRSVRVLRPERQTRTVEVRIAEDVNQTFEGAQLVLADAWIRVVSVAPGSAGDKLGLKANQIITGVNGSPIESVEDAMRVFETISDTPSIQLDIKRRGRQQTLEYRID